MSRFLGTEFEDERTKPQSYKVPKATILELLCSLNETDC